MGAGIGKSDEIGGIRDKRVRDKRVRLYQRLPECFSYHVFNMSDGLVKCSLHIYKDVISLCSFILIFTK